MSTSEGDGKCSEDNVVISEGIYYLKLFIKGELRGKNDCISGVGPFHSVSIFDIIFCWRRISNSKN